MPQAIVATNSIPSWVNQVTSKPAFTFAQSLARWAPMEAAALCAITLLRAALPTAFAFALGLITQSITDGTMTIWKTLAFTLSFFAAQSVSNISSDLADTLGQKYANAMRSDLLDASLAPRGIAHLEADAHRDTLANTRTVDTGVTGPRLADAIGQVVSNAATTMSGYIAALALVFYWPIGTPLVIACWLLARKLAKLPNVHAQASDEFKANTRLADETFELVTHKAPGRELRVFGMQSYLATRYRVALAGIADEENRLIRNLRGQLTWAVVAVVATYIALTVGLALAATRGTFSLGAFVTAMGALVASAGIVNPAGTWWLEYVLAKHRQARDAANTMLLRASNGKTSTPSATRNAEPGQTTPVAATFSNVTFAYENGAKVLHNFNLSLEAGSRTAIVGLNGAGKSTLIKLLCGLYTPDDGSILIDGSDLRSIDPSEWRRSVAVIFQDFMRIQSTVRDNIAPMDPDAQLVQQACSIAGIPISSLDRSLSALSPDGTDLSGGQWQRVALARVLYQVYKGARIVILDEPTANLDIRAERTMFREILSAVGGVTVLLVSHRPSTITQLDHVVVIEGGSVVERGEPSQLREAGGAYSRMFVAEESNDA